MSGNTVRDQPAFQPGDLIAQHQLTLLQALQMQLVGCALIGQARDNSIKVAMFTAQAMKFTKQRVPIVKHVNNPR